MIDDPLAVAILRVIAAAVLGDLDDLLEIPIGPLLARARVGAGCAQSHKPAHSVPLPCLCMRSPIATEILQQYQR